MITRTLGELVSVEVVRGVGLWRVEVDPNELESAIINLAVNARDAMPDGGNLTLDTANVHIDEAYALQHAEVTHGQYVLISVSDTGMGMDAKTLSQAFEPFFTTKPAGHGTGLGLSQVYGFVKQSGGHINLYSELGEGSTVKIYLPRWGGSHEAADIAPQEPVPEADAAEVILVLEDDDDVRTHSVESLRELGYTVIEAHNGPAALELIRKQPRLDLLFTDVVLPGGMTGAQVAARPSRYVLDCRPCSPPAMPEMQSSTTGGPTEAFISLQSPSVIETWRRRCAMSSIARALQHNVAAEAGIQCSGAEPAGLPACEGSVGAAFARWPVRPDCSRCFFLLTEERAYDAITTLLRVSGLNAKLAVVLHVLTRLTTMSARAA